MHIHMHTHRKVSLVTSFLCTLSAVVCFPMPTPTCLSLILYCSFFCTHMGGVHVGETPELSHFIQHYRKASFLEFAPPFPCIS